jgi:hypothetical protein
MFGGQHRDDEVNGPSELGERESEGIDSDAKQSPRRQEPSGADAGVWLEEPKTQTKRS